MRRQAKGLPELRAWRRVTYVSLLLFQEAKFFPKTRESLGGLVSSLVNGFLGRLGHLVHGWEGKGRAAALSSWNNSSTAEAETQLQPKQESYHPC